MRRLTSRLGLYVGRLGRLSARHRAKSV